MFCILVFVARFAKERRLRIWRDYVAPTANLDQKDKQFVAKVSHSWHLKMPGGHCQLVLIQRSEQSTQSRHVSVLSHWGLHACAVIACACVFITGDLETVRAFLSYICVTSFRVRKTSVCLIKWLFLRFSCQSICELKLLSSVCGLSWF